MTTMNGNKLTYVLVLALGTMLGSVADRMLDDTSAELKAVRTNDGTQNEKIARMEEQIGYLRADLLEIKASQRLILEAVRR